MTASLRGITPEAGGPTLAQLFRYFLFLGLTSVGGPVAQISMMFEQVVLRRGWIDSERFTRILAVCHVLPGPEALELAIYIGYLKRGIAGGLVAGLLFIVPGALLVTLLAWAYVTFGQLPQVGDVLLVLKPVVLGIIAAGLVRLARAATRTVALLVLVVVSAVLAHADAIDVIAVLLFAGLANLAIESRAPRAAALVLLLDPRWLELAWVFLKTGLFSFGGAYTSLAILQQGAVDDLRVVSLGQLLDGVALGAATPGPFMLFTTFVGYLAAGVPGAVAATVLVFAPSFAWVLLGAGHLERLARHRSVGAFLAGTSAAVVGVIAALSAQLALAAVVDLPTAALALLAFAIVALGRLDSARVAIFGVVLGALYAALRAAGLIGS